MIIATSLSYPTIGGPEREHATALKTNLQDLGGANRREETTNLPGFLLLESVFMERCACATRNDPESDQIWAMQDYWPGTTRN